MNTSPYSHREIFVGVDFAMSPVTKTFFSLDFQLKNPNRSDLVNVQIDFFGKAKQQSGNTKNFI